MRINVIPAKKLSQAQAAAWQSLQRADSTMDSPFLSPRFTQAVADVTGNVEVAVLEEEGRPVGFFPFQRRRDNVGRPVGGPVSDFHGMVLRPGASVDAHELLQSCGLSAWHFRQVVMPQPTFQPYSWFLDRSPYIDTSRGFEAYWRQRREAGSQTVRKTLQKLRNLERQFNNVRFENDVKDKSVFDTLMEWKAAQLRKSRDFNLFSLGWTRRLLGRLLEYDSAAFSGSLSAMYVDDELQAAFYCLRSYRVLHIWIAAYHPRLAKYSPGYQLLVNLIQSARSRGIDRIDLGRGDERFKDSFATGAMTLAEGSVDSRPATRALRWVWHCSRHWIGRSPLRRPASVPWRLIRRVQIRTLFG